MSDKENREPGDEAAPRHREGLGERLHHTEQSVEDALKDALARIENRVILAGEAETSASPEVNFASAIEVVLNPPHARDDDDEQQVVEDGEKPAD